MTSQLMILDDNLDGSSFENASSVKNMVNFWEHKDGSTEIDLVTEEKEAEEDNNDFETREVEVILVEEPVRDPPEDPPEDRSEAQQQEERSDPQPHQQEPTLKQQESQPDQEDQQIVATFDTYNNCGLYEATTLQKVVSNVVKDVQNASDVVALSVTDVSNAVAKNTVVYDIHEAIVAEQARRQEAKRKEERNEFYEKECKDIEGRLVVERKKTLESKRQLRQERLRTLQEAVKALKSSHEKSHHQLTAVTTRKDLPVELE